MEFRVAHKNENDLQVQFLLSGVLRMAVIASCRLAVEHVVV